MSTPVPRAEDVGRPRCDLQCGRDGRPTARSLGEGSRPSVRADGRLGAGGLAAVLRRQRRTDVLGRRSRAGRDRGGRAAAADHGPRPAPSLVVLVLRSCPLCTSPTVCWPAQHCTRAGRSGSGRPARSPDLARAAGARRASGPRTVRWSPSGPRRSAPWSGGPRRGLAAAGRVRPRREPGVPRRSTAEAISTAGCWWSPLCVVAARTHARRDSGGPAVARAIRCRGPGAARWT